MEGSLGGLRETGSSLSTCLRETSSRGGRNLVGGGAGAGDRIRSGFGRIGCCLGAGALDGLARLNLGFTHESIGLLARIRDRVTCGFFGAKDFFELLHRWGYPPNPLNLPVGKLAG